MQKIRLFFTALFFSVPLLAQEQFVSLTLCSDRLLAELARPEQIAAQSIYSTNPLMMLDKVNQHKPALEARLTDLLPYLDKTILLNEQFYPQLVADLKKLGVKIFPINDSPQTAEQLFALILQLGKRFDNEKYAQQLVAKLKNSDFQLNQAHTHTLILSDTGVVEPIFPQYQVLLKLLGLTPLENAVTAQNFSLEKLLRAQPNWLISIRDKQGYNEQAEVLNHPLLANMFPAQRMATMPLKYGYCFDHGVWQGAEMIYRQLNKEE
ncbi:MULTISPECIES: helical backbone metal receptor [unclassified Avibacterium]|uniref:helical backbone metal receptor n=1 Tax=unclassified Avibacterium TaxID=2685287 RepID=UPI0020269EBA|nr:MULTISPECIES: helical backbone metal receptor [unclassified Avibacterium]MCW9697955.1 helical backbone metal receptor [Avibacterium sp. 20-129]URL05715.1 helical backbone metal receptor [Avibacterium sp. 21-595]